MRRLTPAIPLAISLAALFTAAISSAQPRGPGPGGGAPRTGPAQSGPTQARPVGPRTGAGDDDEPQGPRQPVAPRAEPSVQAPADPLAVSPELAERIGSDFQGAPPPATGELKHSYFPYYEETKGDYRFRFLPPLVLEHTRAVATPREDLEGLYSLLYYRRRSPDHDADVLFPLAWRWRDHQATSYVLGPIAHREAPFEHDNWLAPAFFEGERKDGGYFHSPLLLTTTHWGKEGAFTLVGPYFRDRTGSDVDMGVAPLFFHGDNGDLDGARRTYTLVPPLFYYHREREFDESSMTVIGPVIPQSNPKRDIFDVAPLYFHITGKPATGGVQESHTTLFPFFHYGYAEDRSLFVVPGYLRRTTKTADTMLTPFFSHATTRSGATSLSVAGPILPIYYRYEDKDIGQKALGIFPFYYGSDSPTGHTFATPLYASKESYGVSRSHWVFPNLTFSTDLHGWETDLHPIVYLGRTDHSTHTVFAPIFWDFANPKGRTTIGFPAYWRFADTSDDSVTQVAGNTLYMQKRVSGGLDWQFHFLPLLSFGENPSGHWWNLLFGLTGYERSGSYARIKAFWVPITVDSPSVKRAASAN